MKKNLLAILFLFSVTAFYGQERIDENKIYQNIKDFSEFQIFMNSNYTNIQNWYFVQSGKTPQKEETRKNVYDEYPTIKKKILSSIDPFFKDQAIIIFKKSDSLISISTKVITVLDSFSSYEDPLSSMQLYDPVIDTMPKLNISLKKEIDELLLLLNKAYFTQITDREYKSKIIRITLIFASLLILLVFIFLISTIRSKKKIQKQKYEVEKQKHLIEEKNREITDSISYALRIQTAILPPQKIVKQYLENSFILYKPKDIVAGDFYWMETVDDLILFAACDCTGHGVPGAMVSVVCHNALNRAVREFRITQPSAILDKTTEIVIENFAKSEEDIKDGMDISLCAYNPKTQTLQWSGANNPLWLIKNNELIEIKADKQPIGMNENGKPFTNHQFSLNKNDSIFLFTDGFADQFGGETGGKKLTRKRFKQLLLSIQDKPMHNQGIILDNFIIDYRKEVEQIDDILVMGVRV
ncbi:MAG: hypothetical protein K0S44_1098 [Bacteroidetes bacterium]|jgi:serine phosphatase RsbU (regulator of sigma subunit)|nr:hypothetical protein [Bacteroidota bacterium]